MGCSHAGNCPLFPYLNASMAGWREAYCDSADGWSDCARYKRSRAGQPVPLALLPNGQIPVAMLPNVSRNQSLELTVDMPDSSPRAPADWSVRPDLRSDERLSLPPPSATRPGVDLNTQWVPPQPVRWWTRMVYWLRAPA
jgi:hypothetical protein